VFWAIFVRQNTLKNPPKIKQMGKSYFFAALFVLFIGKLIAQPAGWNYTLPIVVTENSGTLVTDYQARLTVNTQALINAGQMLSNGDDIRFGKDCAGSSLYNYWIESGINTSATVIWIKIDTLYPSATRTIYMFYGNALASSNSAVNGTFNGPMSATDSVSSGGAGGVTNSQRGFRFAPNEDILLTSFGKYEPTGSTRYVTLFNFTTQAILAQGQVSGPSGQYSYAALPNPMWLTMGTQYLLELYQGASDGYYYGTSSQIGQQLTYFDMRYCNSCTQNTFPTSTLLNYHYGYPDLWYYTKKNVTPAPTVSTGTSLAVSAGPNQAYCFGGSASIGSPATGGSGTYAYSWSPVTALSSPTTAVTTANPTVTTVYTLTVTDACGTVVSSSVTVTVNPLPLIATASSNDSICPGGNMDVMVTGTSSSYLWMPGSGTTLVYNVAPASTTTYTVVGTDANGCMNSDSITITVEPLPIISVSGTYSSVCDNAITPLTMTASGASTYDWNSGAGTGSTFTDTPSASTTYTVVGTDALGCMGTGNYSVTFNQAPTALATASNSNFCAGTCITVVGTVFGGTSPYTYLWTPTGNTALSFLDCPTISTCYTLTGTDANGCSDTAMYCVVVNPLPQVVAAGPGAICLGNSATLNATGSNISSIAWSPASSLNPSTGFTVVANPTTTTTYTIVATSPAGCMDSTSLSLTVNPLPSVSFTSTLNTVCLNDGPVTLSGGSPAGGTYSGAGVGGSTFTPITAGNGTHVLTYTYTDGNGCSGSATHTVIVNPCTGINEAVVDGGVSVYPNPFSTTITISRAASSDVTVNIFDAQGKLVLSKKANGSKIEIETSELANGIYSLQLVDETGTKTFRVAKE
jgi:hypothetical protein